MRIRGVVTWLSAASVALVVVLVVSPRWPDRVGGPRPLPHSVTRTIVAASGGDQVADPGRPLAAPLVALVRDDRGRPLRGATVRFTTPHPAEGSGALLAGGSTSTAVTDGAGRASVDVVAPTRAGEAVVVAWVAGSLSTATFTVRTPTT